MRPRLNVLTAVLLAVVVLYAKDQVIIRRAMVEPGDGGTLLALLARYLWPDRASQR